MTQELSNKLIAHYEEHIKEIEKMHDVSFIKTHLKINHMDYGICHSAIRLFKVDLTCDNWANSKCRVGDYWFDYPKILFSKKSILEALQYRVNILKTFKD